MIRLALRRPVSTLVGVGALCALGVLSLLQLPVSLLPDAERPAILVTATAPDRSREEMLHGVTEPFERRLLGVAGLAGMTSETDAGSCRLELRPDWQVDASALLIEVARRIDGAAGIAAAVDVSLGSSDAEPIVTVAVRGGDSPAWRSAFARDVVRPELARLGGAARIDLVGMAPATLVVRPRAADLAARGLTAEDVRARLEQAGRVASAGLVGDGAIQRPLVVHELVRSPADVEGLVIAREGGAVPLRDVATVTIDEVSDGSAATAGGEDAVLLRAFRAPGANAVALARDVRRRIESIARTAPDGASVEVVADGSREVVAAIRELVTAACLGLVLGTIVLRLMLGGWGPTLALCAVAPASLLTAFAAFRAAGIPLDVVSLSGLALAAGMLVDNSIVVVEAIESARARGESEPAVAGTRAVALAVVASCATAVVVFLPLLALRGLARAFFGEQAFAVTASLSVSLLFALTLTPLLSSRQRGAGRLRSPGLAAARRALEAALRRPRLALALGALVTAGTLLALAALPRELFPPSRPTRLRVEYELPPGLSNEASRARGHEVAGAISRAVLAAVPSARVVSSQGGESVFARPGDHALGRIDVEAADARLAASARTAAEASLLAQRSVRGRVTWRSSAFVESLARQDEGLVVVVASPDAERLGPLQEQASSRMRETTGGELVPAWRRLQATLVSASWDVPRLVRLGASRAAADADVRAALGGLDAGRAEMQDVEPAIRLGPTEPADLALVPVRVAGGDRDRVVAAGALLSTTEVPAEPPLLRENGRPARRLVATGPLPRPQDAERALDRVATLPGETVALSGAALELQRAFAQLRLVALLGLALCFLVVAVAYESLVLPLLNMSAVPVAFGGGLLLLAVTGQSLNVMSAIGLIVLAGLATNHSVVLVDRIEQLRKQGVPEDDALRGAVAERYRPVLMTTLTMLLGLLPLALAGGEGQELRRSLAVAVLGGLVTSTLATIVLVPILHRAVEPFRRRRP